MRAPLLWYPGRAIPAGRAVRFWDRSEKSILCFRIRRRRTNQKLRRRSRPERERGRRLRFAAWGSNYFGSPAVAIREFIFLLSRSPKLSRSLSCGAAIIYMEFESKEKLFHEFYK